MFLTFIILAVIALFVAHLWTKRRDTVVYRKRVANTKRGYSIADHPCAFGADHRHASSDSTPNVWPASDVGPDEVHGFTSGEIPAFGGGDFGGGGAGDSYDSGPADRTDSSPTDYPATDSSGGYTGNDQAW